MDLTTIILIVVGSIVGVMFLIVIVGKISSSRKKINIRPTKKEKKTAAPSQQAKAPAQPTATASEEFVLDKPITNKKAIVTQYSEFDDDEKAQLGKTEDAPQPQQEEKPEIRRKSFEEIMRNRQQNRMPPPTQEPTFDDDEMDDDFEQFRAKHSSFIPYQKDESLIEEIKDLPPQMRAVIFNNIFNKIDEDK